MCIGSMCVVYMYEPNNYILYLGSDIRAVMWQDTINSLGQLLAVPNAHKVTNYCIAGKS